MTAWLLHWRLRSAPRTGNSALRAGAVGPVCAAAGHQQAEFLLGDGGRAEGDYLALVHDGDPVGQGVDLVELGRDDKHRRARVPLGDQALVHELDRADVEPSRGLAD